jgi:hypothetical protein
MKQITNKTIIKQGDKAYPPVEVDGVVYWVDPALPIEEVYPHIVIEKLTTGEYMLWQIDNINDIDRSCQYQIVAQSQPKLEEIPVVSLDKSIDDFIYEYQQEGMLPSMAKRRILTLSNPNQYTQKDIDKAIELAREEDGFEFTLTKEKILQQINSISVIEVDEQFNIISYE